MYYQESDIIARTIPHLRDEITLLDGFVSSARETGPGFSAGQAADKLKASINDIKVILNQYELQEVVRSRRAWLCPEHEEEIDFVRDDRLYCSICEREYDENECIELILYNPIKPLSAYNSVAHEPANSAELQKKQEENSRIEDHPIKVFVSYSRANEVNVRDWIISNLEEAGFDVWFDRRIPAGDRWVERLYHEIEDRNVFVYCMTPDSKASEWCGKELRKAQDTRKFVLPLLMHRDVKSSVPASLAEVQYIDFSKGPEPTSIGSLVRSVNSHSEYTASKDDNDRNRKTEDNGTPPKTSPVEGSENDKPHKGPSRQSKVDWTKWGAIGTFVGAITAIFFGIASFLPYITNSNASVEFPSQIPTKITAPTLPTFTQSTFPTQNDTQDASTSVPLVASNQEWIDHGSVSQVFNGMTMVLVPPNCVDGSTDSRFCIENPYWIGLTEVTERQYTNNEVNSEFPVTHVSWVDARRFCKATFDEFLGDLPTDEQWQYAASGSDEWIYPWGNNFDYYRVVNVNDGATRTVVGSVPEGASWVGAFDMSGNVWEWTYDETDSETIYTRRGGSFEDGSPSDFSSTFRKTTANPTNTYRHTGFRCVRNYG
jgi:hypothetical protein